MIDWKQIVRARLEGLSLQEGGLHGVPQGADRIGEHVVEHWRRPYRRAPATLGTLGEERYDAAGRGARRPARV